MARPRQALSDVTRIAVRIAGGRDTVVLRAIPLNPDLDVREVRLTADDKHEVRIHLVNLPSESYKKIPGPHCEMGGTDTHFELYFQLLEEKPELADRRAAVEITGTRISEEPHCRNFSICDTFETDLRQVDRSKAPICHLLVRLPPASPPVVF
jgi:hypothetical protein